MDRIKFIQISGKEIVMIDYSACKPHQMIRIFDQAKAVVLKKNKECLVLTNFEKTYITPSFLRHVEPEMQEVKHLVKKNAFIGMSLPQRMILKGFNLFVGKNVYKPFDSYDQAIEYLLKENDEPEDE